MTGMDVNVTGGISFDRIHCVYTIELGQLEVGTVKKVIKKK